MPWIFAYGSLMWDRDFDVEERIEGYHREFDKKSTRGWGTSDAPAPVLGLEAGGRCVGLALRLADGRADEILAAIDDPEEGATVQR